MENKTKNDTYIFLGSSVIVISLFLVAAYSKPPEVFTSKTESENSAPLSFDENQIQALEELVVPNEGVELPVQWGDIGYRLVEAGAIDGEKFKAMYVEKGLFTSEYEALLFRKDNNRIVITKENAGYLLNMLWALGLANQNPILDSGEMVDKAYGGAGNFASTGGWTLAKGDAMEHYSKHSLLVLTSSQQEMVERVSKGIYRPCCNNSTHFPDCNHGMAMLGLLELMASQNATEEEMWETALAVNSYWFPDTYLTIATYLKDRDISWRDADPREVLGADYSSAAGYTRIASLVTLPSRKKGGGCGV